MENLNRFEMGRCRYFITRTVRLTFPFRWPKPADWQKKDYFEDLPGGRVDKSLPANAGDMGLIIDQGRFHMLKVD